MDKSLPFDDVGAVELQCKGWIHSPAFDLAFFILSPLAGFALAALGVHYALALPAAIFVGSYLLGIPHYLASFAFYLGDENRAYTKQFWGLFYAGPILICASVAALYLMRAPGVVHAVLFVWNIYHVATQSSGILSLYRRLNGGGQGERAWGHLTLLFANATMAFWFLERFTPLWDPLVAAHAALPDVLRFACLGAALACAWQFARAIRRRGFSLSLAEAACLAAGLLLFTPYLWVTDSNFATLSMLVGHFIQYLAIVWLLNRRKYRPPGGSAGQRWLGRVSERAAPVLVFALVAGSGFFLLEKGSQLLNAYAVFMIAFNSLALTHFYLDGLIWAFKNPYIRKTVGPFLTLETHRVR
jgi:hypothetical protein